MPVRLMSPPFSDEKVRHASLTATITPRTSSNAHSTAGAGDRAWPFVEWSTVLTAEAVISDPGGVAGSHPDTEAVGTWPSQGLQTRSADPVGPLRLPSGNGIGRHESTVSTAPDEDEDENAVRSTAVLSSAGGTI